MDAEDLEEALRAAKDAGNENAAVNGGEAENPPVRMDPNEEIGFHKGSLNTLIAERNELIKMIGNVEAIMKAHIDRLKELGVEFK